MITNNSERTETASLAGLVVYGREECHLCQEMILALRKLQEQIPFDLEIIDIDSSPDLVARYGEKIPVLISLAENKEICHYHLDNAALDAYFAKIR